VDVDEEREQRPHHGRLADRGNLVIGAFGGPLKQIPRKRHLAAGEVEGGERGNDVRMLFESIQQLSGLLEATLPDTQVRQANDGGGAPRRHATVEVPGGLDELGFRLLPASGRRQDAAVVGTAEGGHDVAPLHALGSRAHPLVGARDVVDQLARPEESAEDLVHRGELRQFAGAGCCQSLVGEDESLFDAIGHDEQPTEIRQRQELDVGIAEPAPDRDRLAEQFLAHLRVRLGEGLYDQHPAVLGPILAGFLEDGAGAREPSAPDGPIAEDVSGDPGGCARRPAGSHGLAFPTVGGAGALVLRGGGGVLALEIQRLGKAFERLAGLALGEGEPERTASGCGIAITQGRQAFFDQGRAHHPIMARAGEWAQRPSGSRTLVQLNSTLAASAGDGKYDGGTKSPSSSKAAASSIIAEGGGLFQNLIALSQSRR
jgi:hypothetical protein